MATTIGPDMPHDGRVHNPRHLSIPIHGGNLVLGDPLDTPELSPRSHAPPPNPPFVFPPRPMSASAPSSYSRATGRRPRSAIEPGLAALSANSSDDTPSQGSSALPAFSFNPGASLASTTATLLPAHDCLTAPSPQQSPRPSPARGTHRRGGSEFVGGEYRSGNARMEVLSSSPTKSGSATTSPQLRPVEPTRRGPAHRHAHRRSAAMSSHDLSSITGLNLPKNSSDVSRGSSAPSSPSGPELNKHFSFPILRPDDITQEAEDTVGGNRPQSAGLDPTQGFPRLAAAPTQRKSFSRARVGFSDTLEFIPRPLSLVSSDTSSTVTVRPEKDESLAPLEATPSQVAESESRPSTAGPVLESTPTSPQEGASRTGPKRRGSLPLLSGIPLPSPDNSASPDPSPTKIAKRWSFFGLDQFSGSHSPSKSRPVSLNSCEVSRTDLPLSIPYEEVATAEGAAPRASKKSSKKQKKVKTWAGSILTKRPKGRRSKSKKASRRGPTPPPSRPGYEDEEDTASDSADTKSEPSMPTVMIEELDQDQEGTEAWKPPRPVTEEDTSYPVIDLDAALGPFNTPLPRNPEWEAAQKAGGLAKRQLHSAAGLSRFTGPGMHYAHHQRAQSSPEMPPFEFRRGIHRFGSSSTMADVFEEEEEYYEDSDNSGSSTPQPESTGPKDSETSSVSGFFSARSSAERLGADGRSSDASLVAKRKASDPEDGRSQRTASMKSRTSLSSLQEQVIEEEPPALPTQFRTVEFGRPAQIKAPDSPMSSPVSPRAPMDGSSSSHTTSSSLAPVSPYSSVTQSSSFPSPRSPVSCDANIISTAPSSVTDDSFQSLLMGEPGPEVRKSMDVPSISSSHSNQPRDSLFAQQAAYMNRPPAPGERPASFSAMAFGGRRGSLASLGRLISSSHGERSKLSTEVFSGESEKKLKGSKSRRFSKMMQFWKPKENAQA
ncbi:hypothetical protein INS49_008524 [Diaporthe citri]|uniref:uncharacterized protein n=1 Tax=Diaporthe citri TaxID=83186 RepID=UPI001C821896|nr:uncharacterized protein INS49_008524 [Diaporthe citri]KAG6363425.1 hypothetical protein INS49_008524 [Diaporthe citri]